MRGHDMTNVLKEKLWEEVKDRLNKDKFNHVYDSAQTHLMDVMKDIFENDIELFLDFFE